MYLSTVICALIFNFHQMVLWEFFNCLPHKIYNLIFHTINFNFNHNIHYKLIIQFQKKTAAIDFEEHNFKPYMLVQKYNVNYKTKW